MAKIKLQGHASGSGIITLTAPNTSTDRVISLPDATAITIDASENIGIGVVPEDWHNAYDGGVVQINATGAIFSQGVETYLTNNVYEPQSGGMKYINTNVATLYSQQTGIHNFKTAASGSADAAITWTTPLQITADGRGLSQFTAKAWIKFDGNGTSVDDSHNVASLSDFGTGNYGINFSNSLANAHYCVQANTSNNKIASVNTSNTVQTTGRCDIEVNTIGGAAHDSAEVYALFFGD